jgi:hypothetical protein
MMVCPRGLLTAQHAFVSWKDAQREARHWIDSLNLQNVKGHLIDLREPAKKLRFQGQFRTLVFRAAERLLVTRAATVVLPEED